MQNLNNKPLSGILERQKKIEAEFANLVDWESRYKKIIEIGKQLHPLDEAMKNEGFLVKGCQSQVWLIPQFDRETKNLQFLADSDAILVRGLVSLVLRVYSGSTPQEILNAEPDFIKNLGFGTHLSPSRANGLFAMIKQIKYYALAFSTLD